MSYELQFMASAFMAHVHLHSECAFARISIAQFDKLSNLAYNFRANVR